MQHSRLTRRRFIELVGSAGGAGAAWQVAGVLGLVTDPAVGAPVRPPKLARAAGRPIVILGAGIAGLAAAYELDRAGYECTVLEASHRPGGRNFTIRAGTVIDELGARQVCAFDDAPHLYFNAGPARIPGSHQRLLGYCRELGVPLEIFVNENRNAWVQDDRMLGGRPIRNREYVTDARGFVSELLAKSMRPEAFDAPVDGVDLERLRAFAAAFGDLDDDLAYRGSERAGIAAGGMLTPAQHKHVQKFSELLKSDFWRFQMHWGELADQAGPMMQPVGGMDRIVAGFMRRIGHRVRLNAQVKAIRVHEENAGVDVVWRDAAGELHRISGDYCLNSIPTHILAGLDHNFPRDYTRALESIRRGKLFKIGLQARERFWEREQIYGGISWTSQDITQIWYPGHGIHERKGVLLGAYTFGDERGERFARLTPDQRIEEAIRQGEKVHPGAYRRYVEGGVSVAWHRMNHMLGCAARWDDDTREQYFAQLQAPVGTHYLIGDQISYHPGWQEGALASAMYALEQIDRRSRMAGAAGARPA